MSLPVTQFPAYLGALLGLRADGRTVSDFAEVIAPTIDVEEAFAITRLEELNSVGVAVPGIGYLPANITVPAGEVWRVTKFYAEVNCGAAQTATIVPTCQWLSRAHPVGAPVACPISSVIRAGNDKGFFAGPGQQFGCIVSSTTGAGLTINFNVVFLRLRA